MDPDKYQQAWQTHSSQTRVTIDADALLNIVQRSQQELRAAISLNELGTIGILLLLLPTWVYLGVTTASPWTWYLMVPAIIWEAGLSLAVRARRTQTPSDPGQPLISSVKVSLALVEHQLWVQRNIFWWFHMPTAVAMLVYLAHASWLKSSNWLDALKDENALTFVMFVGLFYFIYYMDQRVIRTQHEPRRRELLALLASLTDETTSEVSDEYPILAGAKRVACSPRRMLVAGLCFVAILLIGVPGILFLASRIDQFISSSPEQEYPKLLPFAAVRWHEFQPEVQLDDEWFKLVSLNDVPAADIVAFSQQTYGNLWRKRFEEDLVELLSRMGHPPQDTVKLIVQSLKSEETQVLDDVPMTEENRQAIKAVAQTREIQEP